MKMRETNDSFTTKVDQGDWPYGQEVPLDTPFEDERGTIQNLLLKSFTSLAIITSKKRTIRANHYHKTDWHYAYVVSGRILYFERAVGSLEIPACREFRAGQMFFTPPDREHCMAFAEDTVFITAAKNVRSHENHEADLVRVDFVEPEHLGW